MKGTVEIVLKDEQGNVVHQEKDHNLVTNFFKEYFRPLGTTKGYPYNYNIEDMVGGILLMEDAISPESPTTVLMPAGNKMTGNAVVGVVNGSGTGVTEMGSYVAASTGWQENGDYQMQFEWTPSQANGQISAICLTSKIHGYTGEGNSTSKNRFTGTSFSLSSLASGETHARSEDYAFIYPNSDNSNYYYQYANLGSSSNDLNIAKTGKLIIDKYYFPRTSIDFYKGIYNRKTPIEEKQYNVPSNIASTFITENGRNISHFKTVTPNMFHFATIVSVYTNSSQVRYVYCLHFNFSTETFTAERVEIPTQLQQQFIPSGGYYRDAYCLCDNTKLVLLQDYATYVNGVYKWIVVIMDIQSGTYSVHELDGDYIDVGDGSIHMYHDGVWYLRLRNRVNSDTVQLIKIDTVLDSVDFMNGRFSSGDVYGNDTPTTVEYPLASYTTSGYYRRNPHYLATIYNLQTPVTKTANLSMQITYTLSFAEEE